MNTISTTPQIINFGKYKGTALSELDHDYVNWLLSLDNINADLRKSLEILPWIQEDLDRTRQLQRRKKLAIDLQSSYIPSHERKAYKHNRGRGWNNSTGWN